MITCTLPGKKQSLVFTEDVVNLLLEYRQHRFLQLEAGGQLFAKIEDSVCTVSVATRPKKTDRRGMFFFWGNRKEQQDDIVHYFNKGLHFIGDWHSHPQTNPAPSYTDLMSMKECFNQSTHELNYFVYAIVGKTLDPKKIWIGIVNSTTITRLKIQISNEQIP